VVGGAGYDRNAKCDRVRLVVDSLPVTCGDVCLCRTVNARLPTIPHVSPRQVHSLISSVVRKRGKSVGLPDKKGVKSARRDRRRPRNGA
jgi:hypothetical protein